MNRRFRGEHNVLRLEVDVGAFPLVDLGDCRALIEEWCGTDKHDLSILTYRPLHRNRRSQHDTTTSQDEAAPARVGALSW